MNKINKKSIFIIFIVLLGVLFFIFYKGDERNRMVRTLQDNPPKQIEILKTGNGVVKKVVTSEEDIEKIISFIKNMKLKNKNNTHPKGWAYSMTITAESGIEYNISFLGGMVSIDNTFYNVDETVGNNFIDLYKTLNYKEVKPFE